MSRPARQFPKPALNRLEVHPGDHRRDDPHVSCPHRGRPVRHRTPRAPRAPHPPRRRRCLTERRDSDRRNRLCRKQHDHPRSPAQRQQFRPLPIPSTVQPPHQRYRRRRVPSIGRLWPQRSRRHPIPSLGRLWPRRSRRRRIPSMRTPGLQRSRWCRTPSIGRLWPQGSRRHWIPSMGWPRLQGLRQGRAESSERSRRPPPRAGWSLSDRSPRRSAVPEPSCRLLLGLGQPWAPRRQT